MNIEVSTKEKTWAILIHLSAYTFFLFPPGLFLSPLVLWLLKRNDGNFIDQSGRAALNFSLSLALILILLLALWSVGFPMLTLGGGPLAGVFHALGPMALILAFVIGIVGAFYPICAAIDANKGLVNCPPIAYKFFKLKQSRLSGTANPQS